MKLKKTLGTVAVLSVLAAGVTGPAIAGNSLCSSNRVCIYIDEGFIGLLGQRSPGGNLVDLSAGANDKMSSWENKTNARAAWYEHIGGGGACRNMEIQHERFIVDLDYNDMMSSWRTDHGCP